MKKPETSIGDYAAEGRKLLEGGEAFDTHREFGRWVDRVANWLDKHFPGSGLSATWSGLQASTLVTGRHYYDTPEVWNRFYSAVRERLSWLGELSGANTNLNMDISEPIPTSDVFVVHGHDEELKQQVARTLTQLGLNPIILHERPNRGQTIIEKFERESDVGFAVVLLTPDDFGYSHNAEPESGKNRARQNVVLELGYFVGKLGRSRVCALKKGDIEVPSDFAGVAYTPCDSGGAWRFTLGQELAAAGYEIDLNQLIAK